MLYHICQNIVRMEIQNCRISNPPQLVIYNHSATFFYIIRWPVIPAFGTASLNKPRSVNQKGEVTSVALGLAGSCLAMCIPDLTQHLWLDQISAPRYVGLCCVYLMEVSGSPRAGDQQLDPVVFSTLWGIMPCNTTLCTSSCLIWLDVCLKGVLERVLLKSFVMEHKIQQFFR